MNTIICLALLFTCTVRDRNVAAEPDTLWNHPAVRVSRISLSADDRSIFHRHTRPLLIIPLQEEGALEGEPNNLQIVWHERFGNLLNPEAKTHSFYNPGPHTYSALEIEFSGKGERLLVPRFSKDARFQRFDLPGFNLRRYAISPGEVFLPPTDCGGVILALTPSLLRSGSTRYPMMRGDVIPSGEVENVGGPTFVLAVCPAGDKALTSAH